MTRRFTRIGAGAFPLLVLLTLSGCAGDVKLQRVEYTRSDYQMSSADGSRAIPDLDPQIDPNATRLGVLSPGLERIESIEDARIALESIYDTDAQLVGASMKDRGHDMGVDVELVDERHARLLSRIIEIHGWPTRDRFGLKGVQGAYIAVQHADHDPEFQSWCLGLIQTHVRQGKLPGAFLALMTDRVCLERGDQQLYGTQMTIATRDDGSAVAIPLIPIHEEETLDDRRAELGLPPHSVFTRVLEQRYHESANPIAVSAHVSE